MTESSFAAVGPGAVLADKFRVEQVLGQGGMGVVVAAHHLQLDERVALKFLLPEALADAEAVARFAREARAAVKIKSEHVARVTDVGTMDNGSPYMVMEYLHGTDLCALVRTHGALAIEQAVEYVLQACEALAEAHALGIVHRDLKPANLFLTTRADSSACIKVLDFGISKVTTGRDSEMSMTRTATVMGSPLYMSPEQMASSRDVDTRTDIWAIGAILHELLTGVVPFTADTMPQLCAKILQEPPPQLRDRRPDAPDALGEVISRCLQKDPKDRYPTVAELAADLLPFVPVRGRMSVERITKVITAAGLTDSNLSLPTSSGSGLGVSAGTTQKAWGGSKARGGAGARWLLLVGGALVLVGAAALAVITGVFSPKAAPLAGAAASGSAPVVAESKVVAPPPRAAEPAVAPADSTLKAELAPEEPPVVPPPKPREKKPLVAPPKKPARPMPAPEKPTHAESKATDAGKKPGSKPSAPKAPPAVDLYQDRK